MQRSRQRKGIVCRASTIYVEEGRIEESRGAEGAQDQDSLGRYRAAEIEELKMGLRMEPGTMKNRASPSQKWHSIFRMDALPPESSPSPEAH